ncbi:unannotated protein [freshwater metagenome]|uniref:Unannotated protein n=1 Tax=freshwater metagenome TaxID=449393 RepID=A0A6J7GY10_9ZZZZ|nr:trypsin-like serine protease [Actinomycetota bacterium]
MRASRPSRPVDREAGAGPPASPASFPPAAPLAAPPASPAASPASFPPASPAAFPAASPAAFPPASPASFPAAAPAAFPPASPTPRRRRLVALVAALLGGTALAAAGPATPAGAVVNGTRTPIAAAPYAVQLVGGGETFCSGSLVRPRIVLTAAHCLVGAKRVRVVVGRQDTQGTDGAEIRAVSRAYDRRVASRRNGTSAGLAVSSDVGMLELSRDVTEVPPIALAGPEHAPLAAAGSRLTVSGWGVVGSGDATRRSSASRTLRSATAPVRSAAYCRGRLRAPSRGVLCVGKLRRPVAGACFGDSGGPLHAPTPAGPVQVGVVSSSPVASCGRDTTFYARVQSGPARSWIDAHLTPAGRLRGGRPLR